MTRDFEIIFENKIDLKNAKTILQQIKIDKKNLNIFNEIEERDKSLFVTLTYPYEVKKDDIITTMDSRKFNFFNEFVSPLKFIRSVFK